MPSWGLEATGELAPGWVGGGRGGRPPQVTKTRHPGSGSAKPCPTPLQSVSGAPLPLIYMQTTCPGPGVKEPPGDTDQLPQTPMLPC